MPPGTGTISKPDFLLRVLLEDSGVGGIVSTGIGDVGGFVFVAGGVVGFGLAGLVGVGLGFFAGGVVTLGAKGGGVVV